MITLMKERAESGEQRARGKRKGALPEQRAFFALVKKNYLPRKASAVSAMPGASSL